MNEVIYTIGHSTQSVHRFISLLVAHSIEVVCDVRSRPYSRYNPQFNREALKQDLRVAGMQYLFLGKELGARPDSTSCYIDGKVSYELLAQSELFRSGIERVREGARRYRIALMCAEKEPLDCHRTILVSRQLVEVGAQVKHILWDSRIEDHEQAIERLITVLHIPQVDMFRPHSDVIDEAYAQRGNDIAYAEQSSDRLETVSELQNRPGLTR